MRNHLSIATIQDKKVLIARTGYTGEPLCFELFINSADTPAIWDLLIDQGAHPVAERPQRFLFGAPVLSCGSLPASSGGLL